MSIKPKLQWKFQVVGEARNREYLLRKATSNRHICSKKNVFDTIFDLLTPSSLTYFPCSVSWPTWIKHPWFTTPFYHEVLDLKTVDYSWILNNCKFNKISPLNCGCQTLHARKKKADLYIMHKIADKLDILYLAWVFQMPGGFLFGKYTCSTLCLELSHVLSNLIVVWWTEGKLHKCGQFTQAWSRTSRIPEA